MKPEEFAAWWLIIRDILLVLTGLALLVYFAAINEVPAGQPEPKWPYAIATGLLASPVFLRRGDRSSSSRDTREEQMP